LAATELTTDALRKMYATMLRIRIFEEMIGECVEAKEIRTPCHLYIGEEAIAVGVCAALDERDYVWGAHRSHGHYIAKSGDLQAMASEVFCRSSGCASGRGGSMHLCAPEAGVFGTVPIVAGTIPLAVGAALSAKLQSSGRVSISFFGDGATEEGHFNESLNIAAVYQLPVVFVCENNLYSSHLHILERRPKDNIVDFGALYGIPSMRIDGNDVEAVYKAAARAVGRARAGEGPSLIEYRTYRWRGHVGPAWDLDVGVKRKNELDVWMPRCPILKLKNRLIELGEAEETLAAIETDIRAEVETAIANARAAARPDEATLMEAVFAPAPRPDNGLQAIGRPRIPSEHDELQPIRGAVPARPVSYVEAIREAHAQLLGTDPNVFVLGQGLWSPWYVGASMKDVDKEFGRHRVLDTPVSENATTGVGIGAALTGMRPIVVHPRMDFMMLAMDPIVNQAANWSYMFDGRISPSVVIRAIINRGGEQGAQHSQALQALFMHIPGLKVVMPATAHDAKGLLVAAVYDDSPVMYIDDRWLYAVEDDTPEALYAVPIGKAALRREGSDVTIVGSSWTAMLAAEAGEQLAERGVRAEVIDLRSIKPWDRELVCESVRKTGRLVVADGGWATCGVAAEIVATVVGAAFGALKSGPVRVTLPDAPAPTSASLEDAYYPTAATVATAAEIALDMRPRSVGRPSSELPGKIVL